MSVCFDSATLLHGGVWLMDMSLVEEKGEKARGGHEVQFDIVSDAEEEGETYMEGKSPFKRVTAVKDKGTI
ncbi:hypothetical protein SK128_004967 [Halocaridina rubra]|uniref:Uncharacterized protein n=1 Tax=Halocaridina rubra TaxID=373956 RepID=A0AAN8WQC1_HALRR